MSESKNPPKDLYLPRKYGWEDRPQNDEPRIYFPYLIRIYHSLQSLQSSIFLARLEGFISPENVISLKSSITRIKKSLKTTQDNFASAYKIENPDIDVTGFLLQRGHPAGEILTSIERTIQEAEWFVNQRKDQRKVIETNQATETFPTPKTEVLGPDVVPEDYSSFKPESYRGCETESCKNFHRELTREEEVFHRRYGWDYSVRTESGFIERRETARMRAKETEATESDCSCGLCVWVETFCPLCRTHTKYKTRYKTRG